MTVHPRGGALKISMGEHTFANSRTLLGFFKTKSHVVQADLKLVLQVTWNF